MKKFRLAGACLTAGLALVVAACAPPTTGSPNLTPVAVASASPLSGTAPLEVTFSSAGSSDPDGSIVSHAWDFGDGNSSTDADPVHTYLTGGSFTATLTVTDDKGATAQATVLVDVTAAPVNQPPTAAADASPNPALTGQLVTFFSAGSGDTDGTITYAWDFGDGNTSTEADPTHRYATAGSYPVTLTVTDDDGATDVDSDTTVTVNDDPTGRYVATTGSDAGTCASSAAPCLTVNYAVGQAAAADTIYLAAGSYGEIVNPSKALTFKGANSGVSAGVDAGERGPESTVRGFRASVLSSAAARNLVIDGVEIDPTSDPALLTNATAILNVFGGPTVSVVNNVFTGGHTFVPDCGFTCTSMGDYALQIRGGNIDISDNAFVNWRRPLNVVQSELAAPITSAQITGNSFTGITSRAMSIGAATGQHNMAGVIVDGNSVDATGRDLAASTPAGITITNHSNQVTNNTFTGLSSGVFINLCKKFSTDNNTVTGNTFVGNGGAVNITTIQDGSQCVTGAAPGNLGWVAGGGEANGTEIHGNTFIGQTAYAVRFNPNYGIYTTVVTDDPIDATCNWYGDAAGPGGTNGIVQGPPTNAQITATPWLTAAGGACDGGL